VKLLLISYFFPPHGGGGVLRAAETVRLLAERGWEITVIAGPEDGWWVCDESLSAKIPDSVQVIRPRPSGLSALFGVFRRGGSGQRNEGGVRWLKRLAAWLPIVDAYGGWARSVVRSALDAGIRPDWILSSSPPESSHMAAMKLAGRLGARWAADFRDPWTVGIYRRTPTWLHRRWHESRERKVIEQAELVIATTEETAKDFRSRYPMQPRDKVKNLPNGFDPSEFSGEATVRKHKLPLRLIHAGNLTLDRDISSLLEAIVRVNRDGVLCRLELAGQVAPAIEQQVRALGLERAVTMCGYISRPELLAKLATAHAGLLVEAFRPGAELVVPGKLYDYLGASLPVVALVPDGAAANLIRQTGSGIVATEPDPMRLENLLRQLIENLRRGAPALRPPDPQRIEQYQRPRIVGTLAGLLEK
jgi:glycosyltransferase involved in cell wall biosynthesis